MPDDRAVNRTASADPDGWRLFSPRLDDGGAVYAVLRAALTLPAAEVPHALEQIARERRGDELFGLRVRAAALLLRDLVGMGWEHRNRGHWIELRPPGGAGSPGKEAIRRQLEFGRADQFRDPATRRFVIGLERPSRTSGCRPVTDLIADGRHLAARLAPIAGLPRPERADALRETCRPYLQLVEPDLRDEHTGLRLMDVWRYFRHTWVTRYRSAPGRNLFYLVRDAAQPMHPVMAIAALGNAVMQLTPRDDALGWTTRGLRGDPQGVEATEGRKFRGVLQRGEATEEEILGALRRRLVDDIDQIYVADLPVGPDPTSCITDEVLDRLQRIEEQSTELRVEALRDTDEGGEVNERIADVTAVDLEALARTPLFRAKRARSLRELLRAHRHLTGVATLDQALSDPDANWAVEQGLRQLKKRHSATAMMEITVCGAVAPYNQLLAGKLACLLVASPRVCGDYAARYGTGHSIIASQMAGRPISKPPALVFLGTASLYTQRSSQYNRVELPAGTARGQRHAVRYEELGISKGFGASNLSAETEAALNRLAEQTRQYRNVNFVFGEGQSPKLRQLREGFAALGLNQANLVRHGSPRIVYGVRLAENTSRYLLGIDTQPDYCVPPGTGVDDEIAEFWRCRWLGSRLEHRPALEIVARSRPLAERVSRLMVGDPASERLPLFLSRREEAHSPMSPPLQEDEKLAFVRQLYRDESAYSDNVKLSRLRELNIKTRLDDLVRKIVRVGGSAVITGNAGDGKTHTLKLIETELKSAGAEMIADASEMLEEQVAAKWAAARAAGRPFCIAINEGPLVDLIRANRTQHPWLEEVRQQLLRSVELVPVDRDDEDEKPYQPATGETVVIDLSLRRTLAPDLVGRIVDKLTDDGWYAGCAACAASAGCPVTYNRRMLRTERVKRRLTELLDRVGERGVRATFRETLAFVSFLLFGGRSCVELRREAHSERTRYYWNAFEGQGAIFEQLELGLDPVRQTNARIDEQLWRGEYTPEDFAGYQDAPVVVRNLDEVQQHDAQQASDGFTALKRRWYFEHASGRLVHISQADRMLRDLQDKNLTTQLRVGRLIGLINGWWNRSDLQQEDRLRLWTRLSYSPRAKDSPRAKRRAMVSGREVSNLTLNLFRPRLAPALRSAFGGQAVDHLVLAPPENVRFASLVVDRRLLAALLTAAVTEQAEEVERRLTQFNDALAQHAQAGSHVRLIELLDPDSELNVRVRVDLAQRRYDSAQ